MSTSTAEKVLIYVTTLDVPHWLASDATPILAEYKFVIGGWDGLGENRTVRFQRDSPMSDDDRRVLEKKLRTFSGVNLKVELIEEQCDKGEVEQPYYV